MTRGKYALYLTILLSLACISRFSIDIYLPSLPKMVTILNTNQSHIQLTLTLFMVGYAFSSILWGTLSDRLGVNVALYMGMAIFMVATLVCLASNSIILLIFARFFQGLGGGAGTVLSRIIAKDFFEKSQYVRTMTYLSTGVAISPVIAPLIGAWLDVKFGWKSSFLLLFIVSSLSLFFAKIYFKKLKRGLNTNALKPQFILLSYKYLLSNRLFITYALSISFSSSILFSFISLSPFLFQKTMGASPEKFAYIFALAISGFIAGTSIARKFVKNASLDSIIFIGILICFFSSLVMLLIGLAGYLSIAVVVLPMMLIMCGIGMIMPVCQIAVADLFSEMIGIATGLFFFIQMSTNALTGILLGYFSTYSQLPMSALMTLVSSISVLSFYFLIIKKSGLSIFQLGRIISSVSETNPLSTLDSKT